MNIECGDCGALAELPDGYGPNYWADIHVPSCPGRRGTVNEPALGRAQAALTGIRERVREQAHKRGHGAYHFAKSATARKMKDETILADEVGGAYRRGFYEAKTEDEALKGGGTNVLSRLKPSQRISIDVEVFEGKSTSYATLYDKNLETPENEEGFVAAAEVLDTADLGVVLAKLFEDPDVGSL